MDLQQSFKKALTELQRSFNGASMELQRSFKSASNELQVSFKGASSELHRSFTTSFLTIYQACSFEKFLVKPTSINSLKNTNIGPFCRKHIHSFLHFCKLQCHSHKTCYVWYFCQSMSGSCDTVPSQVSWPFQ